MGINKGSAPKFPCEQNLSIDHKKGNALEVARDKYNKAWMKNELLPTQRLEDMLLRRQTSGEKAEASQSQDLYPVNKPQKSHRKREQFKKSRVVSSGFQND